MLIGGLLTAHYGATLTFPTMMVIWAFHDRAGHGVVRRFGSVVVYMALEPHARRLWPTSMVA